MSRARNRGLPVLRVLVLLGVGALWAIACGGPQPLGATGTVCFRADECQAGLACVPETMGAAKHVCSADLSGIVSMVDGAPPDGETPEATGGSPPLAQGGSDSSAGMSNGSAGKPGAGGATGTGGRAGTAGSPTNGGAATGGSSPAGGSPAAGGSSAAGAPAGGSSAGNASGGAENGGASAGTGA